jgi:FkbM family methyltransferase
MANKRKRRTPMKTFVEVGVGLFGTCRQLIDNGWRGIMVEPLKDVCDKIPKHPNLIIENLAISTQSGTDTLLRVENENYYLEPEIYLGMSGLKSGASPLFDSCYEGKLLEITVETITLEDLFSKHGITEIDFLKVDTEGMDIHILSDYSFNILPTMIKFEHVHGSGTHYDYSIVGIDQDALTEKFLKLLEKLRSLGYLVWQENEDVYCVR